MTARAIRRRKPGKPRHRFSTKISKGTAFAGSGLLASSSSSPRGLTLKKIDEAVAPAEPRQVMLKHPFPPRNQLQVPACVACSIVAAMEILDARRGRVAPLSAAFSYWTSRPVKGDLTEVELRTGLRRAQVDGVCLFELHRPPFTPAGALREPTLAAFEDARTRRLVHLDTSDPDEDEYRYFKLREPGDVRAWRRVLARGFPLIVAFHLGTDYDEMTSERPYVSSGQGEAALHACVVIGFDDHALGQNRGALRIKDSRGRGFADRGQWWFPYGLLASSRIDQGWALTEISYDS